MWVARVEFVESAPPVRVLRWATVDGLQSRGEVTFQENSNKGTSVELSVSCFCWQVSVLQELSFTWTSGPEWKKA